MELIISLLVLAVVVYIVVKVLGMVPVDAQLKQIAHIVLFLIVCLILLDRFGVYHLPR